MLLILSHTSLNFACFAACDPLVNDQTDAIKTLVFNGTIRADGKYITGTGLDVTCQGNYVLMWSNDSHIVCDQHDHWHADVPLCVDSKCTLSFSTTIFTLLAS